MRCILSWRSIISNQSPLKPPKVAGFRNGLSDFMLKSHGELIRHLQSVISPYINIDMKINGTMNDVNSVETMITSPRETSEGKSVMIDLFISVK
jgi:hypothetical protein